MFRSAANICGRKEVSLSPLIAFWESCTTIEEERKAPTDRSVLESQQMQGNVPVLPSSSWLRVGCLVGGSACHTFSSGERMAGRDIPSTRAPRPSQRYPTGSRSVVAEQCQTKAPKSWALAMPLVLMKIPRRLSQVSWTVTSAQQSTLFEMPVS